MAEDYGQKTLDPTPRRRQQARERGHVAHSGELTSAALLLGALAALVFAGGTVLEHLGQMMADQLRGQSWADWQGLSSAFAKDAASQQFASMAAGLGRVLLPLLGAGTLLAIGGEVLQKGFWFLPGRAAPDIARLDPVAGFQRIVSWRGAGRLSFALAKLGVVGSVVGYSLYGRRYELASVSALDLTGAASLIWEVCSWTCLKAAGALLVLAAGDYVYQRWRYEQDLKMSPEEMREEMRSMQGDPHVAARRRLAQQRLALSPSTEQARRCDMVVCRGKQLAVGLRSQAGGPPIVVAKGVGAAAQRIYDLAAAAEVPIVERPALALALYEQNALSSPVDQSLRSPVAQALAEFKGRRAAPMASRAARPGAA